MKVLIVDDEIDVATIVEFYFTNIFPSTTETILASSGYEAIETLKKNPDIDFCISDHNMANGLGSEILDFIARTKTKTKFVLCSSVSYANEPNKYPLDFVFHSIRKPDIENGLSELFNKIQSNRTNPNDIIASKKDNYTPVSINLLFLIKVAPTDLYLKVSENKFIKCIHKSEKFSSEDHTKYLKKSIDKLYVKSGPNAQSVHKVVMAVIQDIMGRENLPITEKICITHTQFITLFKLVGITPELAEASRQNILTSIDLISNSPLAKNFWEKINLIGNFPSRLYTLHSLLASLVISRMHLNSEEAFSLVFAAFLKDISLDSISLLEICDYKEFLEKKNILKPEEIKKYIDNPIKANEILISGFKDYPSIVSSILLEQHEMPNGKGSPRNLNSRDITPLSCVFIITSIFAHQLLKAGNAFDFNNFIKKLESEGYSEGNYSATFNVIKNMENFSQEI